MICPMSFSKEQPMKCIERECAWYISCYTSENMLEYGCAIVLLAQKNHDGLIIV